MQLNRRQLFGLLAAGGLTALAPRFGRAQGAPLTKRIPSSGEALPIVGLGSWITFNVGDDPEARDSSAEVMQAFFDGGGRMIDSSPMYGSAQEVIGYCLRKTGTSANVFATDKVWTGNGGEGPGQIERTRALWGIDRFDLLQVHNLVAWEAHLDTLSAMKNDGKLRYVGITTSHGRRHNELEKIMHEHDLDFVQLTYNIVDREVEDRLLPLAQEKGIAVIANRPFRRKELIHRFEDEKLPEWADDIGAASWAQFLLKFVIAHPAITCAIPATTRVDHVRENLTSAREPLPDEEMRRRMVAYIREL
ncbi:MAG: aldo/keto reductase [Methyloceanibacter sp.]|nr:aldo/keto reductase [Methyloceanibacter sp.]